MNISGKVNQSGTAFLHVDFKDENGVAVTPSVMNYTIRDLFSGQVTTATTAVTPTSSSHNIPITQADTANISSAKETEYRIVTMTFQIAAGRFGAEEFYIEITNLLGI